MKNDPIAQALGLAISGPQTPADPLNDMSGGQVMAPLPELPPLPEDEGDHNISVDYTFARKNLYTVLHRSMHAFEGVCQLAQEGPASRPYEVMAMLLKTITDTNNALIELTERKTKTELSTQKARMELAKDVRGPTEEEGFVGSASEALTQARKRFE